MDDKEKKILTAMVLQEWAAGDIKALYDVESLAELGTTVEEIQEIAKKHERFLDNFNLYDFLYDHVEMLVEVDNM